MDVKRTLLYSSLPVFKHTHTHTYDLCHLKMYNYKNKKAKTDADMMQGKVVVIFLFHNIKRLLMWLYELLVLKLSCGIFIGKDLYTYMCVSIYARVWGNICFIFLYCLLQDGQVRSQFNLQNLFDKESE